jgi:hypothetical protein
MKHVPVPDTLVISLTNIQGEAKVFDGVDDRGLPKPAVVEYRSFLLARTGDMAFYGECNGRKPIEGIAAADVRELARTQINENGKRKYGEFQDYDDEVADRLRQAILHPRAGFIGPSLEVEHNWYPWQRTWKPEPLAQLPAVVAPPQADQPS